jgi:hypothetical protein
MMVNLGLFLLVWESIAVIALIPARLMVPEVTPTTLLAVAGLSLPLALIATWLVDRFWIGEPGLGDEAAEAPSITGDRTG